MIVAGTIMAAHKISKNSTSWGGIPFRFPIEYLSEWNRSILPHHNPQIASKKHLV